MKRCIRPNSRARIESFTPEHNSLIARFCGLFYLGRCKIETGFIFCDVLHTIMVKRLCRAAARDKDDASRNIHKGDETMKNIVLCCAAGMSTSMLVQRMKEAAQKKGIEVSIKAVPVAEFKDNLAAADIILLGPQVKYEQAKLQALADPVGKKVAVIDMMDYGMMKGDAVLDKALKLME
jgi:PTS system cellobiose-specific IIB component